MAIDLRSKGICEAAGFEVCWVTMIITIKVTPHAKKSGIKKISETHYEIKVDAPAEKGRANARLIEMLADYFSTPKSKIRIARGHKTRNKVVNVSI